MTTRLKHSRNKNTTASILGKASSLYCVLISAGSRYSCNGHWMIHVNEGSCALCLRLLNIVCSSVVRVDVALLIRYTALCGNGCRLSTTYRCRGLDWCCCCCCCCCRCCYSRLTVHVCCRNGRKISAECCWTDLDLWSYKDWTSGSLLRRHRRTTNCQRRCSGYQRSGGLYCTSLWL